MDHKNKLWETTKVGKPTGLNDVGQASEIRWTVNTVKYDIDYMKWLITSFNCNCENICLHNH